MDFLSIWNTPDWTAQTWEKKNGKSELRTESWLKPPRHSQARVCILEKSFPSRALTPTAPLQSVSGKRVPRDGRQCWRQRVLLVSPCVTSRPIPSPSPSTPLAASLLCSHWKLQQPSSCYHRKGCLPLKIRLNPPIYAWPTGHFSVSPIFHDRIDHNCGLVNYARNERWNELFFSLLFYFSPPSILPFYISMIFLSFLSCHFSSLIPEHSPSFIPWLTYSSYFSSFHY